MTAIWTQQEADLLLSLLSSGASIHEIAEHLSASYCERSPYAVRDKIRRIGLHRQPEATIATDKPMSRDGWGRDELTAMDDAFGAAMEATGCVRRDPEPPKESATVAMRASPEIHSLGSGWQI